MLSREEGGKIADGLPPAKNLVSVDASNEEIAGIVDGAIPPATKKATSFLVNAFTEICQETGLAVDVNTGSVMNMNNALHNFYTGVPNKSGEIHRRSSYLAPVELLGYTKDLHLRGPLNVFKLTLHAGGAAKHLLVRA